MIHQVEQPPCCQYAQGWDDAEQWRPVASSTDPWSDPYLSFPMMTSDPLHIFPSHALTQSETLVECKEYN